MTKNFLPPPFLQWAMLLLSFSVLACTGVQAQDSTSTNSSGQGRMIVRGKVSDANGPLAGVNVMEKRGTKGAITDAQGNFELAVSGPKATLVFSFVGYNTMEVPVNGKPFISTVLEAGTGNTLSGVVVTALGITRSKKSLGYDVGQISGDDMDRVPQSNAMSSMAGKVSGVVVSQTGARP